MISNTSTSSLSLEGKRVWVAGHTGMVGSAIVRRLQSENCSILTATRQDLDLMNRSKVEEWLAVEKPEIVFHSAATVGGIHANATRPAEFIYDNIVITSNIVNGAWKAGVEKLMNLGSACIYPREAEQPMAEEALLTGPLEPTNEWYAVAKIAGIKMCQAYRQQYGCDFISAQPNNLYGPGDNFDFENSHVVPALIRKAHEAKLNDNLELTIWGSGAPLREFLYIDDLVDALVFLVKNYSGESHVNIGTGKELTIRALAELVAKIVEFEGTLVFDCSRPDGMPRKLLDCTKLLDMGWRPQTSLKVGLARTYEWYLEKLQEADDLPRGLGTAGP